MTERIRATYWIETPFAPAHAAEVMAGEQSSGTFTRLPGETDELRAASAARVERITELDPAAAPSLPYRLPVQANGGKPVFRRAEVELSWPIANTGPSLPNLLSTIAGNLFELKEFSGLRLLDVSLPDSFSHAYRGPQFAIEGTRRLTGVEARPLIGTIIKPSVGLSPAETAQMVSELIEGGIDFIKDDELQANGPHNPLRARVDAIMPLIRAHAEKTGKKVMYAFNITGEISELRASHDYVVTAGGSCVMVVLNSIGLPGLTYLRSFSEVPIHAHRAGWGLFSRSPHIGMSFPAYQKLWRVAGVDHLHVNGLRNKFTEANDSVIASARACLTPMFERPGHGCEAMPVFSSGQTVEQVADTWRAINSVDLIYCCGGGIMAHPGGIGAGVTALRQAWQAALAGIPQEQYAREHVELAQAIRKFQR